MVLLLDGVGEGGGGGRTESDAISLPTGDRG